MLLVVSSVVTRRTETSSVPLLPQCHLHNLLVVCIVKRENEHSSVQERASAYVSLMESSAEKDWNRKIPSHELSWIVLKFSKQLNNNNKISKQCT